MKALALVVVLVLGLGGIATADPYRLDYRATDPSCIDAARFADEVSAKLGFVPWNSAAAASVRIRIERDGDHFTGSFLNHDGSSKIIDGGSCGDVTASLEVTAATALDRRIGATALDRRIGATALDRGTVERRPAPPPVATSSSDDGKVPVTFASTDGGRVDISLNTAMAFGVTSNGTQVASGYFEPLCTSPCIGRVPRGHHYLMFVDAEADSIGNGGFQFDQPTTITATHASRKTLRRALFITGLVITAFCTYEFVHGASDLQNNSGSFIIGSTGAGIGLGLMLTPLFIHDTFSFTTAATP